MRDWEGKDTNKTVAVTCDYSQPNCEREFTEFVTFKVTLRCASNDGASPSISGTHGPSTPAKSAKKRKTNGMKFSNRDKLRNY
jgi:hypothetical protein